MPMFEIVAIIPGLEPDTRAIKQSFYVMAESGAEAIAFIKTQEGVDDVTVRRELSEDELRQFRYLQSIDVE